MLIVHSTYKTDYRQMSDPICKLAKKMVARSAKFRDTYAGKYLNVPAADARHLREAERIIEITSENSSTKDDFTKLIRNSITAEMSACFSISIKAMIAHLPNYWETVEYVYRYTRGTDEIKKVDIDALKLKPDDYVAIYATAFIRWLISNRQSFHLYNDVMMAGLLIKENHDYSFGESRLVIANGFGPDVDLEIGVDTSVSLGSLHSAAASGLSRFLRLSASEAKIFRYNIGLQPWWIQSGVTALLALKHVRSDSYREPDYKSTNPILGDCYYSYFITARQPGIKKWRILQASNDKQFTECDVILKQGLKAGYDQAFSLLFWKGVPDGYPKYIICDPYLFSGGSPSIYSRDEDLTPIMKQAQVNWMHAVCGTSEIGIMQDADTGIPILISDYGFPEGLDLISMMELAYLADQPEKLMKVVSSTMSSVAEEVLPVLRRITYE